MPRTEPFLAPPSPGGRPEVLPEELEELVVYGCSLAEIAAWYRCRISEIRVRLKDPVLREIWKNAPLRRRVRLKQWQFRHAEKNMTMALFLGRRFLGQDERAGVGADDPVNVTVRTGIARNADDPQDEG